MARPRDRRRRHRHNLPILDSQQPVEIAPREFRLVERAEQRDPAAFREPAEQFQHLFRIFRGPKSRITSSGVAVTRQKLEYDGSVFESSTTTSVVVPC